MIEPAINEGTVRVYQGDARTVLAAGGLPIVDAVVTDPPYELKIAGRKWDSSGVAFDYMLWRRVFGTLKPGGWLLAFGATRTYHRLAVAIEDAGFEIMDMVAWLYATGFPKGGRLKPAMEPICLARKPGRAQRSLNLRDERVPGVSDWPTSASEPSARRKFAPPGNTPEDGPHPVGRVPANVIFDEEAAAELDAQSGESVSRRGWNAHRSDHGRVFALHRKHGQMMGHDDEGGASRFFYVAKPSRDEKDHANTHLTVKPIDLMRHLLALTTRSGDTVLDPFCGSGTTALACRRTGRRFVGIELEAENIDIITRRLYREAVRYGRDDQLGGADRAPAREPLEPEPAE